MKSNNCQRFVIAHDIFSRDVFIDITVEFQPKIPIKKRRRVLTEHNFKRVLAFYHGDVLVKCKWWMEIERTCRLFVSWYKFVSIFLAFKHKDTETEAKQKVFLSFGYLTRKPQSSLLEAFFGIQCSLTYIRLSVRKNHSKATFFLFI